jgi:hypothetical protein
LECGKQPADTAESVFESEDTAESPFESELQLAVEPRSRLINELKAASGLGSEQHVQVANDTIDLVLAGMATPSWDIEKRLQVRALFGLTAASAFP